jgi:hypothetical protein
MDDGICPWCGAYSTRSCEMEDENGMCPWQEHQDANPDPDRLREDRDERRRMETSNGK